MAPTQTFASPTCSVGIRERFRYNSKSDIWSLGVLWYELEMLQIPVNPTNIPQLLQRINDGELDALPAQDCAVMSDLDVNILDINSNVRPRTDDLLHDSIVVNLMKEFVTYMCGPGLSVEERQQSAQHIGIMKYSARLSGYLEHCHAFESLMETRFNDSVAKPQCFFPHTETDEYLTLFCIAFSTLAALPVLLKSSPDLISCSSYNYVLPGTYVAKEKVVRRQMRKQLYVEFECAKAIENITEFITLNRSQLLNEHSSQALVMISKYKPPGVSLVSFERVLGEMQMSSEPEPILDTYLAPLVQMKHPGDSLLFLSSNVDYGPWNNLKSSHSKPSSPPSSTSPHLRHLSPFIVRVRDCVTRAHSLQQTIIPRENSGMII
ncbi:hypothetical protein BLNAU_9250 [Blattamonas nauphoetae]|uniref:non-specific serine/threonine protein kinase n=1 Tax=Blattamonas nauphoetae TaxID=2049346 RepID=A0ABQ9XW59_9EUKA|nr:hypothetical protein BLNAU_9250 [Blattamonas nauphoetae]